MKFEESEQYKKAKEEFSSMIFNSIYKPELIIPEVGYSCFDILNIFYPKNTIEEIFDLYLKEWKNQKNEETIFPICIGAGEPQLEEMVIFGKKRQYIQLWYDKEEELLKETIAKLNKRL